MKAKEYIESMKCGKSFNEHSVIMLNPDFLMEFINQLCKEQRELCDERMTMVEGCDYDLVNHVKMPEL